MSIGKNKLKIVGESLESRPFARGHFTDSFAVDLSFDVGHRGEISEAIIYNQVPLAPHSATDQGRGYSVEIFDFVTEPMACRLVSRPVFPQGFQVHVAEIVLYGNGFFLHYVCNLRLCVGGLRELERRTVDIVPECDDVDALSVLRNPIVLAVEDFVQGRISHVFECVDNHLKGPALVMDDETLDVFAENHLRSVEIANPYDIEEQGPTGHALVVVLESLLPAGNRECLTGKSSEADVKIWNILLVYLGDVAVNLGRSAEVGLVGLLCIGVPFAGENRLDLITEGSVEPHADSADSREQIYRFVDLFVSHPHTSVLPGSTQ